jgi:hypothetical protein
VQWEIERIKGNLYTIASSIDTNQYIGHLDEWLLVIGPRAVQWRILQADQAGKYK